ncbi:MAG: Asp-tRNA(Asn)/Glu-tRNA(Gln) amidotransferase subunit GatB [Candidatus Ancillula trichonymphae]|jgi:aspartyl-tRNA(Asn)/glutamyl-tRNA(Gln) amidotransferase subunit B|nr:Asp-tRNA(Asn)/Glu-tRNA(Gln) amidotransferase subunit GatB [Candidatus Ancillula trichonymphae]
MNYDAAISKYDPVFGIEVHVEMATRTKMFCPAPNPAFDNTAENLKNPNTMTTPVSLGLPGALPVLNRQTVEYAIMIGLALNCEIAPVSVFSRKNYFYPDLTKNFQTSQYDSPTCINGYLDVELEDGEVFRVEIERAHLEEDAGKNTHIGGESGRIHGADYSLVDYNRAGVPLVEIVTRPVFNTGKRAPEVAAAYVRSLRDIFKALGVSRAQMERGNVRADVNLSLSSKSSGTLGTRTETKNVNSFNAIALAMQYEITRQADLLDAGKKILQETRHWHEDTKSTSAGRPKSDADDYRYFPEPDLLPLKVDSAWVERVRSMLPEMPAERKKRLQAEYNYTDLEMRDVVNAGALDVIGETVKAGASASGARKWWMTSLANYASTSSLTLDEIAQRVVTPQQVAELQALIDSGGINDKIARTVLDAVIAHEGNPKEIVEKRGLKVVSDDSALIAAIQDAFARLPKTKEDIANGNAGAAGPIIGMVMKATKGQANGSRVRELILQEAAK